MFLNKLIRLPYSLAKPDGGSSGLAGLSLAVSSLFLILFSLNLCSLFPYVFKVRAHFSFVRYFSIRMWRSIVVSSFV